MKNTISEKLFRPLQLDHPIFDVLEIASVPFLLRGIESWIKSFFTQEKKPQIVNPKPAPIKINVADNINVSVGAVTCGVSVVNPTVLIK